MGSNFEKTILILDGDKTKSSLAIKALIIDLDEKFNEYNAFCESVKHDVKLEMVNKIN